MTWRPIASRVEAGTEMAIYNVSNATQLQSALTSAVGGDKILLAAGNYSSVSINGRNYASNVTVQVQSFQNPAHFDGLFVQNSKNLTFSGLDLGRSLASGEAEFTQLNWIKNSSNIKLSGVTVHGSLDNNPQNDGLGLVLTNVTGFNINNSKFTELYRGVATQQSANVTIQSSEFKTIRSDGLVNTAVDGIYIEGNKFSDFRPVLPDHADFIQFWNTGQTRGANNITIKNNVMMQPEFSGVEGTGVQGIFISDPLAYGFKNILIQNDLIYSNGAFNGITVNGGTGVQILDNTVVSKATDDKQFWIRLEATDKVRGEGNVADNITLVKNVTGLYQANNINFTVTPTLRSLLPNLNAPTSSADLSVAEAGYELPGARALSPVSSAAGSSLGGLLGGVTGAAVSKQVVVEAPVPALSTSPTLDMSGLKTAMVAATAVANGPELPRAADIFAPVVEAFVPAQHHMPALERFAHFYDHFAALP
jgi:hypothetical protein